MKRILCGGIHPLKCWLFAMTVSLILYGQPIAIADQVQMRNGDQYFGSVLSLNKDTLVIQSDVLGTLRLPRDKVAFVGFGAHPIAQNPVTAYPTNKIVRSPALTVTNGTADLSAAVQQAGGSSNVLQQIEAQYLSDASPEAKAKFNELLGG